MDQLTNRELEEVELSDAGTGVAKRSRRRRIYSKCRDLANEIPAG